MLKNYNLSCYLEPVTDYNLFLQNVIVFITTVLVKGENTAGFSAHHMQDLAEKR